MTFYKLTKKDLGVVADFKASEIKCYMWLCIQMPFEDSTIEVDTAQIAEETGLKRRTVQKALQGLKDKGVFNLEWTRARVCRYKGVQPEDEAHKKTPERTDIRPDVQEDVEAYKRASGRTEIRPDAQTDAEAYSYASGTYKRTPERTDVRDRLPKPAHSEHPGTLQTIQTKKTIQTLSDPERESFKFFCERKARNYEKPVVLLEKWINRNFAELYGEYQQVYGKDQSSAAVATPQEKKEEDPAIALAKEAKSKGHIRDLFWSSLEKRYMIVMPNMQQKFIGDWIVEYEEGVSL